MASAEIARLATPLGAVVLQIEDDGGGSLHGAKIEADVFDKDPGLSEGMRVSRAVAIEVAILVQSASVSPLVHFELYSRTHGGSDTGQWLDAVSFEDAHGLLCVATRDLEWMLSYGIDQGRLPQRLKAVNGAAAPSGWSVSLTRRGLTVRPGTLRQGERALCPFALAYLTTGSDALREGPWFAVNSILP